MKTFTRLELIHKAIEKIRNFINMATDPEYKYWDLNVATQEISNLIFDLERIDILLPEEATILDKIAYRMLIKACRINEEE